MMVNAPIVFRVYLDEIFSPCFRQACILERIPMDSPASILLCATSFSENKVIDRIQKTIGPLVREQTLFNLSIKTNFALSLVPTYEKYVSLEKS